MRQSFRNYILASCAAALIAVVGIYGFLTFEVPFPRPDMIHEVRQSAVEDSVALGLGLRRLAADLWFVRLMQYYGTPEFKEGAECEDAAKHHAHCVHCHVGMDFGAGKYPDFLPIARHIMALDPYFANAGLYSGASLAFNMGRPEEALSLLNWAASYVPHEWKYVTLITAIGYSRAKDPGRVAQLINPLVMEPDCPVMIRQLAAFLNKKSGNYRAARAIYAKILETTRDRFYIDNAKKELAKLDRLLDEK